MSLVNRVGANGETKAEAKLLPQAPVFLTNSMKVDSLPSFQCLKRELCLGVWGKRERLKIKDDGKVKNALRGAPGWLSQSG